jgi:hypothetical protein
MSKLLEIEKMAMKSENTGLKQDTKYKPGQSGNPFGKPKGTRHRITLLAERLLDDDAEAVVEKCVQLAKEGDLSAIKIVMDRLIPPRKDRPVSIDLPLIESIADASRAMAKVSQAVAEGSVTPLEAQVLSGVLENYRKVVETTELEQRITELEKARPVGNKNR